MSFGNINEAELGVPKGENTERPGEIRFQTDRTKMVINTDVLTALQSVLKRGLNIDDSLQISISKTAPDSEILEDLPSSIIITEDARGRKGSKFISEQISYRIASVGIHVLINDQDAQAYDKCITLAKQIESFMFSNDWNGTAIKWTTLNSFGFASPPTDVRAYYIFNYDVHYFIQFEELDQIS